MNSEKTDRPGYRASVRRIQTVLYNLSQTDPEVKRVNPDGIYGEETAEAVRGFQRLHGLTVTGRVDFTTWRKLLSEERSAGERMSAPVGISPFSAPLRDGMLTEGDRGDTVLIVKLMLRTLSIEHDYLEEISDGNLFDSGTAEAVSRFQLIHGLEGTGDIDTPTWNMLARSYNKYVGYNH